MNPSELFEGEEPVYSLAGTSYFESVELCWSGVQVEELFNNYKPEFKKGRYSFRSSASVDQTEVMTGFDINSEKFTNPNVWLKMVIDDNKESFVALFKSLLLTASWIFDLNHGLYISILISPPSKSLPIIGVLLAN